MESDNLQLPQPIAPKEPVKFDRSFTQDIDVYIAECEKNKQKPTVKGFATRIGTDVFSLWQWANKKRKDEQGNLTEELARPHFNAALTKLEGIEKKEDENKLNPKQELFCQLYATDRELFGNGVQTYIEVYEPDQSKPNWYKTAQASASRLLSNVMVYTRINELLEDGGLNDVNVDKQLQMLINQHADFGSKIAAIREYNKLKQRIIDKSETKHSGGVSIQLMSYKDLPSNE